MAETKETIMKYLAGLDTDKLEKLKSYSQLLMIPDESILSSVTMSQMVEEAHTLAASIFPEWTDYSKSDFGEFLVELFALFSEKDFWYINAFANESLLHKMRSYSNAFAKASSFGYSATLCNAASASFAVTFAAGSDITYGRGALEIIADGDKTFTNDEEITLLLSTTPIVKTLTLYEGKQVTEDITYNGYGIMLRKKMIDVESIEVAINNVSYTRVRNFGESSVQSTHFMVLPEEDGSCTIYFGSGTYGIKPEVGTTVTVKYRTCEGSSGNFLQSGSEAPTVNNSLTDRPATAVSLLSDATGGTEPETLDSIRTKATVIDSRISAAYNEAAAENILKSFDFIYKANVYATVGTPTSINYQVIPSDGTQQITSAQQATLVNDFLPYLMLGYSGTYRTNTYVDLITSANANATKLVLSVVISQGYNQSAIETEIRQILTDITSPLIDADYGDSFNKKDTELLIRSKIPGVQNVSFKVKVSGSDIDFNDFTIASTSIFEPINQTNVDISFNVV